MTLLATNDARSKRLERVFWAFVKTPKPILTARDAEMFLEAAQCRPSAKECLETIAANHHGMEAVRASVRISLSPVFISKSIVPFVSFMSGPEVKAIFEGKLLQKLVAGIVYPPTFWDALVDCYIRNQLPGGERDVEVFAWLCLEVVSHPDADVHAIASSLTTTLEASPFVANANPKIREYGHRIQKIIQLKATSDAPSTNLDVETPGGRNDNDFADFRAISIYPTRDELTSTQRPFYRRAAEVDNANPHDRPGIHLDNQFRLLREDMLAELREDLRIAFGNKWRGRNVSVFHGLRPTGLDTGDYHRPRAPSLLVSVGGGLESLKNVKSEKRKAFLFENKRIAPHKGFGVLCKGTDVIGFAFIVRDVDLLCKDPPVLGLQFPSADILSKALVALLTPQDIRFVVVDTPVFAYEPILERLKDVLELPLEDELFGRLSDHADFEPSVFSQAFIDKYLSNERESGTIVVGGQRFALDKSQREALAHALGSPLSVIQGPPGTGKSYIGALATKILHADPDARILVLSYTNHALDQFLEDITKIGIKDNAIVRLGSKYSDFTAKFSFDSLFKLNVARGNRDRSALLAQSKSDLETLRDEIAPLFTKVAERGVTLTDILEYLEFSDDSTLFWSAFQLPPSTDGFQIAGKDGKAISPDYLIQEWAMGKGAGWAYASISTECKTVWHIPPDQRVKLMDTWATTAHKESLDSLRECFRRLEDAQKTVERISTEARCDFIRTKRIIGCTTTGAAMYSNLIKAAKPDYVLVEEAGEILEAHVLTALHPQTKQLILIGDHKQLRPKVNNYALSVEKGDGYDLNRSLFERLILQGHPLKTLSKQHRMVPEISSLVREMTYPELRDADKTHDRPDTRGIEGRIVFINHDKAEADAKEIADRKDIGFTSSKRNQHEARMVLKMVKYLGQQGYKTDDMVVLTPYLGQLKLLREMLSHENDPWLNDLDNQEMIRAGIMNSAEANLGKKRIRLSTIDNYQGEESDIVIVSLTRSNSKGDIGFMKAPERLNVLLSRARNCLLMIGNMSTFMASKQGSNVWTPFMELLKTKGALQDGLWVRCEQHPEKRFLLASPDDFEKQCPEGGCTDPCQAPLPCGLHNCRRQCHRKGDHTKMRCDELVEKTCRDRQHQYKVLCHEREKTCPECLQEEEAIRRRVKRNLDLERECKARQDRYRKHLEEIRDQIELEKRLAREDQEQKDRKEMMAKYEGELNTLRMARSRAEAGKKAADAAKAAEVSSSAAASGSTGSDTDGDDDDDNDGNSARDDWAHQKKHEHAHSPPMDMLMDMTGLEEVKLEFLKIKAAVDTASRQNIQPGNDRYSCVFLGNPGTGKTTVARIYAQFLTSMGIIPGQKFKETTGAKLANEGVNGCQKMIDDVLNNGGGVIFVDEAYQLSSGNSPGGAAVLDFLLAEVENLRGKIVFVLAGYVKNMEAFFAHNPGLPSRFPTQIKFADYTDKELLKILVYNIEKMWARAMVVEDGLEGLYSRIVARRIGRGRGTEGFGNARAIENIFQTIRRRQSDRLKRARRAKKPTNDMLLIKEDMIGPEPSNALLKSEAWEKLQKLIGLATVKESLKGLVDTLKSNYERELQEKPIIEYSLNRVFLGNPGTGKTTVAKLYGQILVDLGMLSNGEVVVKNPADFVAAVVGGSQKQTKGILESTVGKVLVIDEAYELYGGKDQGFQDPYKADVIDTIVSEVHSVPGDDRCVLLLGYKEQMEDMFDNVNPGLARRFPIASAFTFDDFDTGEMEKILKMKLAQQAFDITDEARRVALEMLERARNRPNFGNAGEVDILLNDAKARHQKRLSAGKTSQTETLEAFDFDEDFNRSEKSETNIAMLFKDTIGCERIVATLRGYQETARDLKKLDMDPKEEIPFNFLFRGPPGTGKTTTARKMGKVFYDAGFLSSPELIESSASDLVASYVGQTGDKVRKLLKRARGRVLLIDEAYRLAEGNFAKEALDEIVDAATKKEYHKKLVIILAGYEDDINRLLQANPGLTSRFPESVNFDSLPADKCMELFVKLLQKRQKELQGKRKGSLDLQCLESPSAEFQDDMLSLFQDLVSLPGWANARDIETIAKSIFRQCLKTSKSKDGMTVIRVSEGVVRKQLSAVLLELQSRGQQCATKPAARRLEDLVQSQKGPTPLKLNLSAHAASERRTQVKEAEDRPPQSPSTPPTPLTPPAAIMAVNQHRGSSGSTRDAGVSDEVWEQLLRDAEAEVRREEEYQRLLELKKQADRMLEQRIVEEEIEEEDRRIFEKEQKQIAEEEKRQRIIEERRRVEEERKRRRAAEDERRKRITERLLEDEQRRREAAEARRKLRERGLCPAGFEWIQQAGGYRCAGGSHFASDI